MPDRIEIPEYADEPIDLEEHGIRYGFRHDPMEWVNTDGSPAAARVRGFLFRHPL